MCKKTLALLFSQFNKYRNKLDGVMHFTLLTKQESAEEFQDSDNILCDTVMVGPCHHPFVQIPRRYDSKCDPDGNRGLWARAT